MTNYLSRKISVETLAKVEWGRFSPFEKALEAITQVTKDRAMEIYELSTRNDNPGILPEGPEKDLLRIFIWVQSQGVSLTQIWQFIEYKFPTYQRATLDKIDSIQAPFSADSRTKKNIVHILKYLLTLDTEKTFKLYVKDKQMKDVFEFEEIAFGPNKDEAEVFRNVHRFVSTFNRYTSTSAGKYENTYYVIKVFSPWTGETLDINEVLKSI